VKRTLRIKCRVDRRHPGIITIIVAPAGNGWISVPRKDAEIRLEGGKEVL
jgi:hypothetical protein